MEIEDINRKMKAVLEKDKENKLKIKMKKIERDF
jgi:hypothetical protein